MPPWCQPAGGATGHRRGPPLPAAPAADRFGRFSAGFSVPVFAVQVVSVPVVALPERPRAARVLVARLDVAETPRDLGGGAGAPVRPGAGHLAAGQRLRDAVGAAGGVLGPLVPVALALPEDEQGRPAAAPPLQGVHLLAV